MEGNLIILRGRGAGAGLIMDVMMKQGMDFTISYVNETKLECNLSFNQYINVSGEPTEV